MLLFCFPEWIKNLPLTWYMFWIPVPQKNPFQYFSLLHRHSLSLTPTGRSLQGCKGVHCTRSAKRMSIQNIQFCCGPIVVFVYIHILTWSTLSYADSMWSILNCSSAMISSFCLLMSSLSFWVFFSSSSVEATYR